MAKNKPRKEVKKKKAARSTVTFNVISPNEKHNFELTGKKARKAAKDISAIAAQEIKKIKKSAK